MDRTTAVDDLNGYLLDNRAQETEHRFGALAELFDDNTFRHFDGVGVSPGWRCWEVGAGGPSVANWLAERVGPSGSVVATDIDLSWLPEIEPVRFEARCLDVAVDDPPADGFDLIHARLVLVHVPERERGAAQDGRRAAARWLARHRGLRRRDPAASGDRRVASRPRGGEPHPCRIRGTAHTTRCRRRVRTQASPAVARGGADRRRGRRLHARRPSRRGRPRRGQRLPGSPCTRRPTARDIRRDQHLRRCAPSRRPRPRDPTDDLGLGSPRDGIDEASVRAQLERHWEYAGTDQDIAHEIYHDDAVLEFPQSGERFEGVQNFREWRRQYPAVLEFRIRRIRGRVTCGWRRTRSATTVGRGSTP